MQIASQVYGIETAANGLCFFKIGEGEPAYDLLNTHLHVGDSDFALSRGLFREGEKSEFLRFNGKANGCSFEEFGKRIGVSEKRVAEILIQFTTQYPLTEQLTEASFLLPDTKKTHLEEYRQRRNRLKDVK